MQMISGLYNLDSIVETGFTPEVTPPNTSMHEPVTESDPWPIMTNDFFLSIVKIIIVINLSMPNRHFSMSISFIVFKTQMLQAANTGLFDPLVPKAHNCEC